MNAPDKCPKCGAEAWNADADSTDYECGSSVRTNDPTILRTTLDEFDPCQVRSLQNERNQLATENARLRQWVRDAYEEGYWDCHDRKQFDEAINTSEAMRRLDGRAEP